MSTTNAKHTPGALALDRVLMTARGINSALLPEDPTAQVWFENLQGAAREIRVLIADLEAFREYHDAEQGMKSPGSTVAERSKRLAMARENLVARAALAVYRESCK